MWSGVPVTRLARLVSTAMSRTVAGRPDNRGLHPIEEAAGALGLNVRERVVQGVRVQSNVQGSTQVGEHGLGIDGLIQFAAFARRLFLGATDHKRQALEEFEVLAAAPVLREQAARPLNNVAATSGEGTIRNWASALAAAKRIPASDDPAWNSRGVRWC